MARNQRNIDVVWLLLNISNQTIEILHNHHHHQHHLTIQCKILKHMITEFSRLLLSSISVSCQRSTSKYHALILLRATIISGRPIIRKFKFYRSILVFQTFQWSLFIKNWLITVKLVTLPFVTTMSNHYRRF